MMSNLVIDSVEYFKVYELFFFLELINFVRFQGSFVCEGCSVIRFELVMESYINEFEKWEGIIS